MFFTNDNPWDLNSIHWNGISLFPLDNPLIYYFVIYVLGLSKLKYAWELIQCFNSLLYFNFTIEYHNLKLQFRDLK